MCIACQPHPAAVAGICRNARRLATAAGMVLLSLLVPGGSADAGDVAIGERRFQLDPPAGLCFLQPREFPAERRGLADLAAGGRGISTAAALADCRQLGAWRRAPAQRISRYGTIAYDAQQLGDERFHRPTPRQAAEFLQRTAAAFIAMSDGVPESVLIGEFPRVRSSIVAMDRIGTVKLVGNVRVEDGLFRALLTADALVDGSRVTYGKAVGATIFAGTIVIVGLADRIESNGDLQALGHDMVRVIEALRRAPEVPPSVIKAPSPAGPVLPRGLAELDLRRSLSDIHSPAASRAGARQVDPPDPLLAARDFANGMPFAAASAGLPAARAATPHRPGKEITARPPAPPAAPGGADGSSSPRQTNGAQGEIATFPPTAAAADAERAGQGTIAGHHGPAPLVLDGSRASPATSAPASPPHHDMASVTPETLELVAGSPAARGRSDAIALPRMLTGPSGAAIAIQREATRSHGRTRPGTASVLTDPPLASRQDALTELPAPQTDESAAPVLVPIERGY